MANADSLISVIIPAYNQAEYIPDTLESLLRQTYSNWEAIIVDDGSPDNVANVVKAYAENDSRIKFFHTENFGVSHARNFAVSQSNGEYLLPLDADDIIAPTYIEKAISHFKRNPTTDIVYCQWKGFGVATDLKPLKWEGYTKLLLKNSIFSSAIFRRSDFDRAGGYDEQMRTGYEDWEFLLRLLSPESIVYQIPEVLFMYRQKECSRNTVAINSDECRNYMYDKHKEKFSKYICDPVRAYEKVDYWERKYRNIWYKKLWGKLNKRYATK